MYFPLGTHMMAPQGPLWCLSTVSWAYQPLGRAAAAQPSYLFPPLAWRPVSLTPCRWVETPSRKEEGAPVAKITASSTHQHDLRKSAAPQGLHGHINLWAGWGDRGGVRGVGGGGSVTLRFCPPRSFLTHIPKEVFQYVQCASLC